MPAFSSRIMQAFARAALLVLPLAATAGEPSAALSQACAQRLPASTLTFVVRIVAPLVQQQLGFEELRTLVPAAPEDAVLGATSFAADSEVEWTSRTVSDTVTGMRCTRVAATIRLGVAPQKVHVAREIAHGTCPYQVVLRHELGHVRINEAQMRLTAETLNTAAAAEFGGKAWYGSAEQIDQAIRAEMSEVWLARAAALLRAARALHAEHDHADRQANGLEQCMENKPALIADARP